MPTSNLLTLVALMNAMIGGTILVLPLMFLSAGLVPAIIVTIVTGAINYWSCKICYDHLRDDADLPQSLQRHTRSSLYPKLYDLMVYVSLQLILLLYFNLVVKQWDAILLHKSTTTVIVNGVVCFLLVLFMGTFKFAVDLLGYGILSIVGYMIFIGWLLWSAPTGNHHYPIATWDFAELCDTLATAFSLQGIFIPILKKNNEESKNRTLLLLSYVLGGVVYGYIGLAGSFGTTWVIVGILNRIPIDKSPETVEDYFRTREWPVTTIAVIYLFHLYSVIPEYLFISKKRCFSLIGWDDTDIGSLKDIVYIAVTIIICVVINLSGISLKTILVINGTIFGFLFIYVLPSMLHIKCIYFPNSINMGPESAEQPVLSQGFTAVQRAEDQTVSCQIPRNPSDRMLHTVLLALMLLIGVFVLSYSIYEIFKKAFR